MIRFMTNSYIDLFRTAEAQLPNRKGRTKQEAIDSVMFRMEKEVIGATNKDALAFLNAAKDFIVALGEVEQKKVDDIDESLKDNDNL